MTIQSFPFLRSQRNFPNDSIKTLSVENDRAYIDIATKVNDRRIALFPTTTPANTGEKWYFSNDAQDSLVQVYSFTTLPATIPHNIDTFSMDIFVRCWGYGINNSNKRFYGIIWATDIAIAGEVTFYITSNSAPGILDGNIVILSGAGAPTIDRGGIILEWLVKI